METSELMICNIQGSNVGKYQDAPNFEASEMSPGTMDKTDRNVLSAISGSKLKLRLKRFPESNFQQTFLMQVFSYTNRSHSIASEHSKNVFHEKVGTALHAKSKFDTQTAKDGYICSILLSCHTLAIKRTSITISLPKFQPRIEAIFIKMLRIVDIPADYVIQFRRSVIMVDAEFESPSYTCTASEAKSGDASSMITDLPALQNDPSSPSIPISNTKYYESQSLLTRFCESGNTLLALPMSHRQSLHEFLIKVNFASNLEKMLSTKHEMTDSEFQVLSCLALLYILLDCIKLFMSLFKEENSQAPMLTLASSTIVIAVCNALSLQSCSVHINTMSLCIPLEIKELLLKTQQSNGEEPITNISLTTFTSLNDKERIEGFQYDYVIPLRVPTTSVSRTCTSAVHTSLSFYSIQSNESIGDSQIKIHSSLSLVPLTTMTSCQDYFERCFDVLATISPQCLLSCVSLYSTCEVCVTTHDLDKTKSIIAVEQFKNLQLLSQFSNDMQLQISRFSDLGMSKRYQKDRVEVVKANSPPSCHIICCNFPPSRNKSKRSIHKRTINKVKKRVSFPKRCLHRPDCHYTYQKLLWSQLRGKKMNSMSLRKGLMFYCVSLHSSLKYQHVDRHSGGTLKAFAIPRAIEESCGFGRRVALFRGGKPSTQKSDPTSAPSDDDVDSGDGHAGAATSHEIPTSSHEVSHSNGAMNLRPSSEAPPPLKMNSGVSQPGGEADRYIQSSQSPAALITKSSEQPLHSQGSSNNCTEPLQDKQVLSMPSAATNIGYQDSHIIQPKLECHEDEDKPLSACTCPQILEQAQEEVSPVLTTEQQNECVLMSAQFNPSYTCMYYSHSNDAHQMHPQISNIEDHQAPCPMVVTCSVPVSNSIAGPGIMGFGAIVEEANSATALPRSRAQAEINHECQLSVLRQQLRGLVLLMRFPCDRISRLLLQSPNSSYNNQLQVIRCVLREIVHEIHCIHQRWHVSQLQFQRIRALLLYTNGPPCQRTRLIELQQLSALHACHSLLYLQSRLEQVNTLLMELLSQLQRANAAAQALHAPPQPRATPQQAVTLPALLPGPRNVRPFQAQVEEDNPSLTQIHSNNN